MGGVNARLQPHPELGCTLACGEQKNGVACQKGLRVGRVKRVQHYARSCASADPTDFKSPRRHTYTRHVAKVNTLRLVLETYFVIFHQI